jgi:transcriptional regulator with XRE-family HTH domain
MHSSVKTNPEAKPALKRKPGRPRKEPNGEGSSVDRDVGNRLRLHRLQAHLSMRELARRAGIAVSYLSNLEAGRLSPSLAMLRKVLVALGTDLEPFFANSPAIPKGHVFRLQQMRRVTDGSRSYTFILPPRRDVRLIMFDEVLFAGEDPQLESLTGDLAGYILTGELILEVQGEPRETLRAGDAFYVPAGTPLRGWCGGNADSVRLVTVQAQGAACPKKTRHRGNHDDHGEPGRRVTEA